MASARNPYRPTPEQLALGEERRRRKYLKQQQASVNNVIDNNPPFLQRQWVALPNAYTNTGVRSFKIMTWNLLAQSLIRSELFPNSSKALKAAVREPMIHAEILSHQADIVCLQEVDRLERLLPALEKAGYDHTFAAGPGKKHGCLIAYRKDKFTKIQEQVLQYDHQQLREDDTEHTAIGTSRTTKNIGSLIALGYRNADNDGVIVATTHLFWHPAYTYERARQAAVLLKETLEFRESLNPHIWPCIIAGDFNFAPDDPAYSLLVGEPLSQTQERALDLSRVIHTSIDPTFFVEKKVVDDGEDAETDADRVITNARPATPSDGLLSNMELVDLFAELKPLKSAYEEGQKVTVGIDPLSAQTSLFGQRKPVLPTKYGACEPMFTSYTHYWKTTLDYIFTLDAPDSELQVTGYISPHRVQDIEAGLPQAGICGSDHFSLCAELHVVALGHDAQ